MNVQTAQRRITALRAAIARCKDLMRSAKRRGDMRDYVRHMNQMYALKQQCRNTQRLLDEQEPSP